MAFKFNWSSDDNAVLLNPRMDAHLRKQLSKAILELEGFKGHYWFATSGSTATSSSEIKLVALSHTALLTSAQAVNQHLQATSADRWLLALPYFHVGGAGIMARAYLSQSEVIDLSEARWDPLNFYQTLQDTKATLTSLVPAHIYDLVTASLKAPRDLRAVIVGGGAISPELYAQARVLGWPLLPSYGLTECASQVATASLKTLDGVNGYPALQLLSHVAVRCDTSGKAFITSKALLTAFALWSGNQGLNVYDPKENGEFETSDLLTWGAEGIESVTREGDWVKIGGESVNLKRLELAWQEALVQANVKQVEAALIDVDDRRLGKVMVLAVAEGENAQITQAIEIYQTKVLPFERFRKVFYQTTIPYSPMRKLLKQQLREQLKFD